MLELRTKSPSLDKWTLRPSRYGALDSFIRGNNEVNSIISPQALAEARTAVGRAVKIPVYDSESVSIGSTRSVTISDSENTSQLYTVSFTTYAWGFTVVPSLFMNNEMMMQEDFERKFMKYYLKFLETLDTACLASLSTYKSQVFADLLGLYTNSGNVLQVAQANKDEILGDLTAIMNANDFYGAPFHIVANAGLQSQVAKMSEYSQYNQQDKSIQWLDKTFGFTNRLANAANRVATGYCINPGSLGMMFRHEREAILGTKLPDGTEWQIDQLPIGLPIDTYFYYGKGDYSAIANTASTDMTRVAKNHYGFAIEVANVVAYNTALGTYANPIIKFEILDA